MHRHKQIKVTAFCLSNFEHTFSWLACQRIATINNNSTYCSGIIATAFIILYRV